MSDTDDIGCDVAIERLLEYLDHELAPHEHDGVERHLRTCRTCFSRMEFESRLKTRLSKLRNEDVPSASRERIRKLIERF